ncbi:MULTISPECIES: helix-turn-helix transcriptional regulator [unclassified Paenibacillus]|uniref:helix-turn-helix domain-containing protein n=1 Tax=unclassified Paenibacillus TaxID=185978 RepID=UPI000365721D|nr:MULTISPECIES: helix-turn-helix transcriptional regulator [unclassified Paenibacillus]ETT32654.1 immunity repressor protein, phage-like protein [Paenibacillus sp. FSL R5-192]
MANMFGIYLKKQRKKKGLNLIELSELSGVSCAQISRIETGKRGMPKPDTLKKFSVALNLNYEDLMMRAGYLEKVTNC